MTNDKTDSKIRISRKSFNISTFMPNTQYIDMKTKIYSYMASLKYLKP